MGFFTAVKQFFSNTPRRVEESHQVWMTQAAKVRGIAADVKRIRAGGESSVVVAHFANTFDGMQRLLEGLDVPFLPMDAPASAGELERLLAGDEPRLVLAMSQHLPTVNDAPELPAEETGAIHVVAVEHHPLPEFDARIRNFAGELPRRCRLQIHAALDDVVLRAFAGDWVAEVLRTLGMQEDEPIESPMIRRRILSAQRRIAAFATLDRSVATHPSGGATGNKLSASAEEWMRRNCPRLFPADGT